MKLVLGYILAFLSMTAFITALCFGLFLLVIGIVIFITWSLPYGPIGWWVILRVCISIGALFGVMFICSKEGQENAKEFADVI